MVIAAVQVAGIINMKIAHILLFLAWFIGSVGILTSEAWLLSTTWSRRWLIGAASVLALAVLVCSIDWWIVNQKTREATQVSNEKVSVEKWLSPIDAVDIFIPEHIRHDFTYLAQKIKKLEKDFGNLSEQIDNIPQDKHDTLEFSELWERRSIIGRELNKTKTQKSHLSPDIVLNLVDQLKSGKLLGKAYDRDKRESVIIPVDQWQFLQIGGEELNEVGGQGTHYAGLQIGKPK